MASGAAFWNGIADKYARRPVQDQAAYEHTLERTRAYLAPADRVLEIGCGTGTTALLLAPSVGEMVASDFSRRMIEIARGKTASGGAANVTFVEADVLDERLGPGPYDAVLAFSLIHLLPDPEAALARIRALLKPGGVFVSKTVCLGDFGRIWRVVVPAMRLVGLAPKVSFMTAADVDGLVERAGFEIVETGVFPKSPPARFVVARK